MKNSASPLLSFGITGFFIFGSIFAAQVIQVLWGNRDIWWTPEDKKIPFEKTKSSFVLFIGGKTLEQHLADGSLFALDNTTTQYREWQKMSAPVSTTGTRSRIPCSQAPCSVRFAQAPRLRVYASAS